jgi:hypothetical protein
VKIKIWTVTSDDSRNGFALSNHATKEAAETEFRTRVAASWEDFRKDEPMPADAHEAQSLLNECPGYLDTHEITDQEVDVPSPTTASRSRPRCAAGNG